MMLCTWLSCVESWLQAVNSQCCGAADKFLVSQLLCNSGSPLKKGAVVISTANVIFVDVTLCRMPHPGNRPWLLHNQSLQHRQHKAVENTAATQTFHKRHHTYIRFVTSTSCISCLPCLPVRSQLLPLSACCCSQPTRVHRWASVDYSSSMYDSETHPTCKHVCRSLSSLSQAPTPVSSATNGTVNLTAAAHAPRPATADVGAAESDRQPSGEQDALDQHQQLPVPSQQQQVVVPAAQQQKTSKLDKLWATHKPKWFGSSTKQRTASPAAASKLDSEAGIDTVAGSDSR
jgi:hypothetical protein